MEWAGELTEILEYRKSPEFYSSSYRKKKGRKFESDRVKDQIREVLRHQARVGVDSSPVDQEVVLPLSHRLFYYIPAFKNECLEGAKVEEEESSLVKMTPSRAVKLVFWYVAHVNHEDADHASELEGEILSRLMMYLRYRIRRSVFEQLKQNNGVKVPTIDENFSIRKNTFNDLNELKDRKKQLHTKQKKIRKKLVQVKERFEEPAGTKVQEQKRFRKDGSGTKAGRKYKRLKLRMKRLGKEKKFIQSILSVPKGYRIYFKWDKNRKKLLEQARKKQKFQTAYQKLRSQRERDRSLSDIKIGEAREFVEKSLRSAQKEVPARRNKKKKASLPSGSDDRKIIEPDLPDFLELKDEYSSEERTKIFQYINSGNANLGNSRQTIRTMFLSGDTKGAVRKIRSVSESS